MQVTICYYDTDTRRDTMLEVGKSIQMLTGGQVLMIPKNYDLLLDCSVDQLLSLKAILDTAIGMKLNAQMVGQSENPADPNNIINIEDYFATREEVEDGDKAEPRGELIHLSDYLS